MAKKEKTLSSVFFNGILNENPTLRLVLGICPTLASTTSATNAVGMGAAATFVLVGSNVVISLLRNIIPDKIRIPAFVVVICTFVTLVEMIVKAFVPALYASLGIFIPLIVVNCIILARAEAFASKNGPLLSAADGLGMGAGFTLAITVIGMVREILGSGSIFGISIFGAGFEPMLLALMAPGGFIVFGLVLGIANYFTEKAAKKKSDEKGVIRA
ncbi:MAG: electron transport complex subunit E [Eubacteriales bacterium]|jgi:electron transport complex protein RnfE|nr:electron transport complex subunit E [Eubacteriales bacterium]MCI6980256.1 electron transport complex subunit E [Clostridiales bacterium]MDD6721692.1 electron transport complex subunit E [Clostridiales bacterium]MDY5694520.1 electron transport complex subunit E [Eubacteriales bacterium]HZK45131.1 electron transport complex subunit E [Clostridia bacterium]